MSTAASIRTGAAGWWTPCSREVRNIKPEYTKEWFSQQVHLCEKSLYRVTVSLLANQTDAEDAMQEALCTAYEKLHTLKEAEKFRPWLLKIATNAAYDILRRRKRTVPLEDTEPVYHDGTAEKLGLWLAVQQLPPDYRSVVVLYYYEDLDLQSISRITGVPEATVKTRLFRARQRLKALLAE